MKRLSVVIMMLGCLLLNAPAMAQALVDSCTGTITSVRGSRVLTREELTNTSGLTIKTQITYAQATPIGRLQPKALCFDFYTLPSDADTLKPLVITVFGGAFVAGSRTYEDMIAWCVQLARRGYSAATIDYRLLPPSQFTTDNLIRAG